ncbi:SCO family protein [Bacillus sp. NEB1478]|uniref:SCO family protein n=1 Tax=Bacillus sp. NEB1478 TaxID=3073816 RepID=UPI002873A028|nr:SCO family protein [Bacillus sp. NEB1478]WNB91226.1 SCO family protein [Bacillus sp. NEB1478]
MKKIILLICLSLSLVLSACGGGAHENHENHKNHESHEQQGGKDEASQSLDWDVQSFSYKEQNGEDFSSENLKGKVWLADFIFTNCETVCPPMTAHVAKLQRMAKDKNVNVDFVSFSIDPKRDDAKALTAFGENYDADFSNWHFVSGYEQKEIEHFAKDSFKTPIIADPKSDQFMHATAFFLVNKEGKVTYRYEGVEDTPFEKIIKDAKKLSAE